ncbi:MAG: RNA polymerase sigma factor [Holdemanella porci]
MEKGLIVRARKKDNEAIAEIIQLTERKAYFIAYKVVNNEATAKDIVQEAYIQAFQKLDQLSDDSKFESWFNQIVSHKALDYTKSKQGKNKPVDFSSLDDEENRLEFEANIENDKASFEPESSMNYKELQEGVQGVLNELPENQRLALMMYYFEDMSVSEIADVYGVSGNTVKGYLAYGRKKIKNIIETMREKGVSFYGVAPMPFLTWMLHDQMTKTAVSHVSKDIIIKTVGTSAAATTAGAAATKTGASKSGFAKWWASKTASVKAGVCAGTVAVTGAAGYAAVDYNSNYKQVERAIEKLDTLYSFDYLEVDSGVAYNEADEPYEYIENYRMYIQNGESSEKYKVIQYADPSIHLEHNVFTKFDGTKVSTCSSDANSFDELDDNMFSEYHEATALEDGSPYIEEGVTGKCAISYFILAKTDTFLKKWYDIVDDYYLKKGGLENQATNLNNDANKMIKERLNNATVTEKNGEKTFSYKKDMTFQKSDGSYKFEKNLEDVKITIDKDGYLKQYTSNNETYQWQTNINITNLKKNK